MSCLSTEERIILIKSENDFGILPLELAFFKGAFSLVLAILSVDGVYRKKIQDIENSVIYKYTLNEYAAGFWNNESRAMLHPLGFVQIWNDERFRGFEKFISNPVIVAWRSVYHRRNRMAAYLDFILKYCSTFMMLIPQPKNYFYSCLLYTSPSPRD